MAKKAHKAAAKRGKTSKTKKTKARAAKKAGPAARRKGKARKAKRAGIGARLSSGYRVVVDTLAGTERLRRTLEKPGTDESE